MGGAALRARGADAIAVPREGEAGQHHGAFRAGVPGLAALDDVRRHHAGYDRLHGRGAGLDVRGQSLYFRCFVVVTERVL